MTIVVNIENLTVSADQPQSLLASNEVQEQDEQTEQKPKKKRQKLSDEEKRERNKAKGKKYYEKHRDERLAYAKTYYKQNKEAITERNKAYLEANREKNRAASRLCADRRRHAHIEGYVPTSEYKRGWSIRDVTDKGYLYLAHDRETGAMKIGMTMCNPENRLSYYKSHYNDGITFLKVSPLLNDVYNAEAAAHMMLRGNVRPVTTANKFKTSTNPSAEWFQMNGKFTITDIIRVFEDVSNQFADTSKNAPQTSK